MGLGLSIARSIIVDKHGGSLTFLTNEGVGTTFAIRLPLVPPAAAKPSPGKKELRDYEPSTAREANIVR